MENKKTLISTIILIFLILTIPIAVYLIGQRAELRKRAALPSAFFLSPNSGTYPVEGDIVTTLMLRKNGLRDNKFDAADFVLTYDNTLLELELTSNDKPFHPPLGDLNEKLEVFKNELVSGTQNKLLLTIRVKEKDGVREPLVLTENLPIALLKFKAKSTGIAELVFDRQTTIVAATGLDTTNFEADQVNAQFSIQDISPHINSITPNYVLVGYEDTTLTIEGQKFVDTPQVTIGTQNCTNVNFVNQTKVTCTLPSGLPAGSYDVTLTNPDDRSHTLTAGFQVLSEQAAQITFKIKFYLVNNKPTNPSANLDYQHQDVKIKITGQDATEIKYQNTIKFNAQEDGTFTNQTPVGVEVVPGTYKIFLKGPRHVQKRFIQEITSGEQTISLTTPSRVADDQKTVLLNDELPGGDLPMGEDSAQDGKVNAFDYQFLVQNRGKTDDQTLKTGDINLDGIINTTDEHSIAVCLQEKLDEDE